MSQCSMSQCSLSHYSINANQHRERLHWGHKTAALRAPMIIRLSHSMMKKLGLSATDLSVTETLTPAPHPLCDWALHLYRYQRTQYIISTNTTSLSSFVFAGRGLADQRSFTNQFFLLLREHHRLLEMEEAFEQCIAPCETTIHWSKVGNRSVTGSMNELILQALYLQEEREWSLAEVSRELNNLPLSVISYQRPVDVHRKLATSRT